MTLQITQHQTIVQYQLSCLKQYTEYYYIKENNTLIEYKTKNLKCYNNAIMYKRIHSYPLKSRTRFSSVWKLLSRKWFWSSSVLWSASDNNAQSKSVRQLTEKKPEIIRSGAISDLSTCWPWKHRLLFCFDHLTCCNLRRCMTWRDTGNIWRSVGNWRLNKNPMIITWQLVHQELSAISY